MRNIHVITKHRNYGNLQLRPIELYAEIPNGYSFIPDKLIIYF